MREVSDYQRRRAQESAVKNFRTHGLSRHPLYNIWRGMEMRCFEDTHPYFEDYGARGILPDPFFRSLPVFVFMVELLIGPRPSKAHTLDRIDNDLGYITGNLQWETARGQAGNRRRPQHPDGAEPEREDGKRNCLCDHDCAVIRDCPWFDDL